MQKTTVQAEFEMKVCTCTPRQFPTHEFRLLKHTRKLWEEFPERLTSEWEMEKSCIYRVMHGREQLFKRSFSKKIKFY